MAKKRLLTWHRPSHRWKKQVEGKVYYFGHGKAEDDLKAYREAEGRYIEFLHAQERDEPVEVPLAHATIRDICERYMQQQEQWYRSGEVTASNVCKVRGCLDCFLDFVGGNTSFDCVTELLLEDYRNHAIQLPKSEHTGKPIRPRTAQTRLATVKALYRWCYEMRLCELPRNIGRYARMTVPEPEPEVFTLDEVRILWDAAHPRLRCFMALGLNCGYGQKDIADLTVKVINLEDGFIERHRSKTKIYSKHRLWPVTTELIAQHVDTGAHDEDRLFVTADGHPLVQATWNGKLSKTDAIKNSFWRLRRKVGIDDGRGFYALRDTGSTQIERINPLVTEMYLAHTEKGMKRHYAERDWDALAEALDELDQYFGLQV